MVGWDGPRTIHLKSEDRWEDLQKKSAPWVETPGKLRDDSSDVVNKARTRDNSRGIECSCKRKEWVRK